MGASTSASTGDSSGIDEMSCSSTTSRVSILAGTGVGTLAGIESLMRIPSSIAEVGAAAGTTIGTTIGVSFCKYPFHFLTTEVVLKTAGSSNPFLLEYISCTLMIISLAKTT